MAPGSSTHATTINPAVTRRGAWSKEEDVLLRRCIEKYGEGNWHLVPSRAGLNRCRKSCRLRWLNYLSPNIKRGPFASDEDDLIIRMQRLLGNRWALIAGRIPGRTANDIKNRWNSHLYKRTQVADQLTKEAPPVPSIVVVKPQAHRLTVKAPYWFKAKVLNIEAPSPAVRNLSDEQFCFTSWFEQTSTQGGVARGGGGELMAPHQTSGEESSSFPLQPTTTPIETELEWENLLLDMEFWNSLDIMEKPDLSCQAVQPDSPKS